MSHDESSDHPEAEAPEAGEPRRAFLLRIARGVTYTAPIIYTLAAPPVASAQASGGMMMMTLCDYFPVLCRWLGGQETTTLNANTGPSSQPSPRPNPPAPNPQLPQAPWSKPPPGGGSMM